MSNSVIWEMTFSPPWISSLDPKWLCTLLMAGGALSALRVHFPQKSFLHPSCASMPTVEWRPDGFIIIGVAVWTAAHSRGHVSSSHYVLLWFGTDRVVDPRPPDGTDSSGHKGALNWRDDFTGSIKAPRVCVMENSTAAKPAAPPTGLM